MWPLRAFADRQRAVLEIEESVMLPPAASGKVLATARECLAESRAAGLSAQDDVQVLVDLLEPSNDLLDAHGDTSGTGAARAEIDRHVGYLPVASVVVPTGVRAAREVNAGNVHTALSTLDDV